MSNISDKPESPAAGKHRSSASSAPAKSGKQTAKQPRPYIEAEERAYTAADPVTSYMTAQELEVNIAKTRAAMAEAAKRTEFLEAARLRDLMLEMEKRLEALKVKPAMN